MRRANPAATAGILYIVAGQLRVLQGFGQDNSAALPLPGAQPMDNLKNGPRATSAADPASLPALNQQGGADISRSSALSLPAAPTVRQLIDLYLDLEGPELSANSLRQRRAHLEAFAEKFGRYPYDQIHKSDLKAWIRSRPSWKSEDTRCNVVRGIKRLFSWAEDDERIPHNPFRKFHQPEGQPRRAMTEDEFSACLRGTDAVFRRVLIFLRYCGCRPGEVAALDWTMVDWNRSVVTLQKHKTRKKTGKPRTLYLSPVLVRLLRWCERNRLPDQDCIFVNARGWRWTGGRLSQRLQELRDKLGLPDDCKLYGLRHKLGTDSQIAGNSLAVTAELLGHDDPRTTAKYYTHLRQHEQFLLGAMEKAGGCVH